MSIYQRAMLSPCIGICSLNAQGLCDGCLRTSNEIASWSQYSDDQRHHIMEILLPEREAHV